jgi:hypothetical protein
VIKFATSSDTPKSCETASTAALGAEEAKVHVKVAKDATAVIHHLRDVLELERSQQANDDDAVWRLTSSLKDSQYRQVPMSLHSDHGHPGEAVRLEVGLPGQFSAVGLVVRLHLPRAFPAQPSYLA